MEVKTIRHSFSNSRPMLLRFFGMAFSGAFSALVLLLIASQRLDWISGDSAVFLLTFIQWQTLTLTISKIGVDQVIFATESLDSSIRFDLTQFLFTRALWLAALSAIVMAFVFSPFAAFIAFLSVVLDVYALSSAAELNARSKFGATIVGNILNYPLFISLAYFGTQVFSGQVVVLLAFLASSAIRCVWLVSCNRTSDEVHTVVEFTTVGPMAIQQVGNYLLFRVDQLAIPILGVLASMSLSEQERYLFFVRFPELVSAGVVIVGMFLFPRLTGSADWVNGYLTLESRSPLTTMGIGLSLLMLGGFCLYQFFWDPAYWFGQFLWSIPFLLHGLLILPVNAVIYLMLGTGHVAGLVRNTLIALLLGLLVGLGTIGFAGTTLLNTIVPIQLSVFLLLSFVLPVGRSDSPKARTSRTKMEEAAIPSYRSEMVS